MRDLGPAYDLALGQSIARPRWRVLLANHGGGYADPLDVTSHVAQVEVSRPLRAGNAASIVLHSEDGQYDPESGIYALAIKAANAQVQIDLGEVLEGTRTYWRVFTGEIASCRPRYGVPMQTVDLDCLDRAVGPWQKQISSPNYALSGEPPTGWSAHAVIRDLFERFAGLTWPGDFALDPTSDWTLDNNLQFLQMALADAAEAAVQPVGYRLFFDYLGRVATARLVPAGLPAGWGIDLTIPAANISGDGMSAPSSEMPEATRIHVVGGKLDYNQAALGDDSVWATVRVKAVLGNNRPRGFPTVEVSGDTYDHSWDPVPEPAYLDISVNGPEEESYRVGASAVSEIRFIEGDISMFASEPAVIPGSETYNEMLKRQQAGVVMLFHTYGGPAPILEFEFDVSGHQGEIVRPQVYCQAWDDALIDIWGERSQSVEAPACFNWAAGKLIAGQEMIIRSLSAHKAGAPLTRLDLRPEAGDVLSIKNPRGADFKLWVMCVRHGCSRAQAKTRLEGYMVP